VDVLDRGVVERYTAARSATDVALDLVEVSR
jgi:translation initiation factor IF-3